MPQLLVGTLEHTRNQSLHEGINTMQNNSGVLLTQTVLQQNMDSLLSPIVIPASKLDADQYVAEDLDGGTENMFGSGNLNFLMMQAGQSNNMMLASNPFSLAGEGVFFDTGMAAATGFASSIVSSGNQLSYGGHGLSGMDAPSDGAGDNGFSDISSFPGSASANSSSISALTTAFQNGSSGLSTSVNGTSGTSGIDGASATPGLNGSNGSNGSNGQDGTGGGDTIIHNTELINLTEIINLGDVIIDLGDFTLIDLGDVTNLITTTITNVTDITQTLIENIFNTLNGGGGLTLQLDAILSNITDLDLDLLSGDTITSLIDQVIDLSPVTDLLEPIVDLDGLILGEVHSIFSLLEQGNHHHAPGDTDIGLGLNTMLGELPLINGVTDIILNPVEDLLGDVDIVADVGLDLFNNTGIDNAAGDTDLTLDLGIGALDGTLLGGGLAVPLDPVEQILGDIDLDIGAATNLLSDVADGLIDNFAGGSGGNSLIATLGDQVGAIADGLLPDIGEINPVSELGLDLFNPQGTDNGAGDSDLTLDLGVADLPLDVLDIPLDPLEKLTGDLDLDIDLGDITGALGDLGGDGGTAPDLTVNTDIGLLDHALPDLDISEALDPLEPLTGDIEVASNIALDMLGSNETDNNAGDTDVDLDLDVGLLSMDIVEIDFIDVPLDPVEQILGDIDLDLNGALDLLHADTTDGGVADLLEGTGGGSDLLAWTENVLPDIGELFGDQGDHGLGGLLPAPIGDIAEGLGGLLGGGSESAGGGLFGGHLGGGLFG